MKASPSFYPGFQYAAHELDQFMVILDLFTIILSSGDIVKHTPDDRDHFLEWLLSNHVKDIRKEEGWVSD